MTIDKTSNVRYRPIKQQNEKTGKAVLTTAGVVAAATDITCKIENSIHGPQLHYDIENANSAYQRFTDTFKASKDELMSRKQYVNKFIKAAKNERIVKASAQSVAIISMGLGLGILVDKCVGAIKQNNANKQALKAEKTAE